MGPTNLDNYDGSNGREGIQLLVTDDTTLQVQVTSQTLFHWVPEHHSLFCPLFQPLPSHFWPNSESHYRASLNKSREDGINPRMLGGRQVGQKTDGAMIQEGWHWKKREGGGNKSSESAHVHLASGYRVAIPLCFKWPTSFSWRPVMCKHCPQPGGTSVAKAPTKLTLQSSQRERHSKCSQEHETKALI